MKQFFSLLDGMMEYRQLKEAIEQGRVPVSLTGAAAAHKTHIIASLVYQLRRPALVIVPDESTAIRFAADLNTLLGSGCCTSRPGTMCCWTSTGRPASLSTSGWGP